MIRNDRKLSMALLEIVKINGEGRIPAMDLIQGPAAAPAKMAQPSATYIVTA